MKRFRRCSCVLLSCILLLAVSSVTVSAKSIETPHYTIIQAVDVMDNDGSWSDVDILEFDITNGIQENGQNTSTTLTKQSNYTFENAYEISTENMPLIPKGNSTNWNFNSPCPCSTLYTIPRSMNNINNLPYCTEPITQ